MAGHGPAPKAERRPRSKPPTRGVWKATPGVGWQHGAIPEPPDGLKTESVGTWTVWFRAWYAANWHPEDVPAIGVLIQLYDQVQRGEYQRATELRLGMDTWGITPKGQQDRRWTRPEADETPVEGPTSTPTQIYGHLRVAE